MHRCWSKSYWFDNLGFFLRENLLLYSSYLPLGVSQRSCDPRTSNLFSGAVVGDLRHHLLSPVNSIFSDVIATIIQAPHSSSCCKGSLTLPTFFTLFIVLLSLLLLCVVCFLYQKPKKISYLLLKLSFQVFYHV